MSHGLTGDGSGQLADPFGEASHDVIGASTRLDFDLQELCKLGNVAL
jgi:hypothetical protein